MLADWPRASRTAAHDIAAKACRAAMDGEIDARRRGRPSWRLPAATIFSRRRRALRLRVDRSPIGRVRSVSTLRRERGFSPTLEIGESRSDIQSPPLRGRCPAGQREALSRKRCAIQFRDQCPRLPGRLRSRCAGRRCRCRE
ncbi:hypothetical protein [Mesorhizobium sp.]|uniref:hypothetical protein n=1 Tax=Mesorhizobium sp. TaxID=1871066 RepID=UPI0025809203|nr:hypothetical protein [Mesorhizobium sp.]